MFKILPCLNFYSILCFDFNFLCLDCQLFSSFDFYLTVGSVQRNFILVIRVVNPDFFLTGFIMKFNGLTTYGAYSMYLCIAIVIVSCPCLIRRIILIEQISHTIWFFHIASFKSYKNP